MTRRQSSATISRMITPVVKGTSGYPEAVDRFIEATLAIDFATLHAPFLEFIPTEPGSVLDIGAGIGRDASVFVQMGHSVVAIEPTAEFRAAGQRLFPAQPIQWIDDALPNLDRLRDRRASFDFVLASAVWHHLYTVDHPRGFERVATLLRPGGVFAVSLRHGPPGVGTYTYPTCGRQATAHGARCGLRCVLHLPHRPSLMPGKTSVTWSRLVFRKA